MRRSDVKHRRGGPIGDYLDVQIGNQNGYESPGGGRWSTGVFWRN